LKNFDFTKTLLLGLGGMDRGILEILACLPFGVLLGVFLTKVDLSNCVETHYLKDLLFLFAVSLFYQDS